MVKLRKNKHKELNKLAKKQAASPTNKILKKKHNIEKKISFQKEILLKQTLKSGSLVKKVSSKTDIRSKVPNEKNITEERKVQKSKRKPVESKKKRQKTQLYDTKLILSLMKKKFNEHEEMDNVHEN